MSKIDEEKFRRTSVRHFDGTPKDNCGFVLMLPDWIGLEVVALP
jgi:hypothetical protein